MPPEPTWTLVGLAEAAGVTRGFARAAVRAGLLPAAGWTDDDVPLLKVAAALLAHPATDVEAGPGLSRDATAIRFARAMLHAPVLDPAACLLLTDTTVVPADTAADRDTWLTRLTGQVLTLIPVGAWAPPGSRGATVTELRPKPVDGTEYPDGEPW